MTDIPTKLYTKAAAELEEEIKKELAAEDPTDEEAEAAIAKASNE